MRFALLPACLGIVILALPLHAEDVLPPEWRGAPYEGQTYQHWDFLLPDNEYPDMFSNVYGTGIFEIVPGGPMVWTNGLPNPNGPLHPRVSGWLFTIDLPMVLSIPNRPLELPVKLLRLQITSSKAPQNKAIYGAGDKQGSNTYNQAIQHQDAFWYTYVSDWILEPNPDHESIVVNFPPDTIVEEVVVDTWCTPEPALLMPLLGLLVLRRRE